MDKLDKLSIWSIAVLIILTSALIFAQTDSISPQAGISAKKHIVIVNSPELDNKIKVARNLLTSNNLQKAEELISGLIKDFPYNGDPFMLMGDLQMRKQDPLAAMLAYRNGVDLNPDYLDKKAALFQGKKVKSTVMETSKIIKDGLRKNPGDTALKGHRKTLYYMLRKIAGSCG